MAREWHPYSWQDFQAAQQPPWPEGELMEGIINDLKQQPPLVFAGEVRRLKRQLEKVGNGQAFLLQGGDCAELFSQSHAKIIKEKLKVLLQMAVVLTFGSLKPVVKVGRIAGQYGKPRSKPTEIVNGEEMLTFRGDSVNSVEASVEARQADPNRLHRSYHQSAATLNLLRAFTHGGFADLHEVHSWNVDFVRNSTMGHEYATMAEEITHALAFLEACGIDAKYQELRQVDLYTSHEGLLLDYEAALTRVDSITGDWYNCSAHMVWIGDRTRQIDGAHVEYMRGINNPIGLKVGPSCTRDDLMKLIETLNPKNEMGRIVLIARFGADKIDAHLPELIKAVEEESFNVIWSCDPMHGNTFTAGTGHKTRHFDHILTELVRFFAIHRDHGTVPGGVHFELTGDDVTECLGGAADITEEKLHISYNTACDPRLNVKQSLEMAFKIAELLKERRASA